MLHKRRKKKEKANKFRLLEMIIIIFRKPEFYFSIRLHFSPVKIDYNNAKNFVGQIHFLFAIAIIKTPNRNASRKHKTQKINILY